ncbi:MAG TPA: hypothetical protein VKR53_04695 [Puia sp.]|nr:hypothetical protein [Puia sp.]
MKKLMRYGFFFMSFLIIVGLAFASKGGDKNKKRTTTNLKTDFVPIRISSAYVLKNGFTYTGSHTFGIQKENSTFSLHSIVTYERGNTTYILPYKYKVNASAFNITPAKGNLQMLDVKISMHK